MGDNKYDDWDWLEQPASRNGNIYYPHNYRDSIVTKRPKRKVETKLIAFVIGDLLGLTGLGRSLFSHLDSPMDLIILMVSSFYIVARAVIMIDKHLLFRREKLIDLKEREKKTK